MSLILFGILLAFAIYGMWKLDHRKRRDLGRDEWLQLAAQTSIIPLMAIATRKARWPTDKQTIIAALIGLAIYAGFILYPHETLIGSDPPRCCDFLDFGPTFDTTGPPHKKWRLFQA